jgi:hypothetical protein
VGTWSAADRGDRGDRLRGRPRPSGLRIRLGLAGGRAQAPAGRGLGRAVGPSGCFGLRATFSQAPIGMWTGHGFIECEMSCRTVQQHSASLSVLQGGGEDWRIRICASEPGHLPDSLSRVS